MGDNDQITQTRLDVAEMKGMLTTVVVNHGEKLSAHDTKLNDHDNRLNEDGKLLGRHDERLKDLEDDNSGRVGRGLGISSLVVAAIVGFITIIRFFNGGM